jgi:hypothetical protein
LFKEKLTKETKILLFIILFTVLSGAIRKWVVNSSAVGNLIMGVQLFSPFYFLKTKGGYKPFENKLFTISLFYLVLSAINFRNLTVFHGMLGIIIHINLFYLLFYYYYNRHLIQFQPLINLSLILCAGELILGFIQYGLPPKHFINAYADAERGGDVAVVVDSVRVTGTFSYLSGYTAFLIFYSFFTWALIKIQYNARITVTLIVLGFVASFMSGSRGTTFTYTLFLLYLLIFEFKEVHYHNIVKSMFMPIVVIIMLNMITGKLSVVDQVVKSYDNFMLRRENGAASGEEQQRIFWDFDQLYNFKGNYPYYGVGLGSTYQGATSLFGVSRYVLAEGYLETELTRVVVEGGFILLILRFSLIISILIKLSFNNRDKIFLFCFFLFFGGYAFNVYNAVFIFLGFVIADQAFINKDKEIQFIQYKRGLKF